jgi:xylulose-5-phosphate/fructose-6-phosphate phosphoketolase
MILKTKEVSERSIVMKVKNGVKENIAGETEKMNKTDKPLSPDLLRKMNAYWRAANYLSVGQIYLYDNPLLREPLKLSHVKPLVVGHWGTTPGQNFIYVHLNRVIKKYDLNMFYIAGPGHGGPAIVGNVYLEGTWSEIYPNVTQDEEGLKKLFKQFSFPGGISSHVAPTTPGSIHEGGELGYSISHAFGAAFDNPGLVVACVIGDGEAETASLATAWQSNKFLDPVTDGAVLPILHLNGYKISNPTVLARALESGEVIRGLAICGSGVGACVAANKVSGVRAALITDSFSAHQGVEDDDMNVMCLGGRVTGQALSWDLVQRNSPSRYRSLQHQAHR